MLKRLAFGLLLVGCSDDSVPPRPTSRPPVTPDAGSVAADPVLPPSGPLALEAVPTVSALAGRTIVLHAVVSGGAGPYRIGWRQSGGPPARVASSETLEPSVTAPYVTEPTDVPFVMTAIDAYDTIVSADVTLRVAPNDLTIGAAERVVEDQSETTLHGRVTGPLEGLAFAWTQTKGPAVTIVDPRSFDTRVTIPFVASPSDVEIEARASNADGRVAVLTTKVAVRPPGPIATAGPGRVASSGASMTVRGSAKGGAAPYRYLWSQESGPAVTLTNASTDAVTLTPTADVGLVLTVTDAANHTSSSPVTVSVPAGGAALAAIAGPDGTVPASALVQLSGTARGGSATYTYSWSQIGGASVTLTADSPATRTFSAAAGTYTFRFTANDGTSSASDDVTITVEAASLGVDAGPDLSVTEGDVVDLSAATRNAVGNRTWSWSQSSGPAVTLGGTATSAPSFVAPNVVAITPLTFRASVSDTVSSANDEVTVTVVPRGAPITTAGEAQRVHAGSLVALDGRASGGVGPHRYAWSQRGGSPVTFDTPFAAGARFRAPVVFADEDLAFELEVRDAYGRASKAAVNVTVVGLTSEPDGPDGLGAGKRPLSAAERTIRTCDGAACFANGTQVVCDERAPFGMTVIGTNGAGGFTIKKRCVAHSKCLRDWGKDSLSSDLCIGLLPPTNAPLDGFQNNGAAAICSYCCFGTDCNAPIFPKEGTTPTCAGDVCYPTR
jgi:large repetitive protein